MIEFLAAHPLVLDILISLAVLLLSYLVAALIGAALAAIVSRTAVRNASGFDDRLRQALRKLVTGALFLLGAWISLHRLALGEHWIQRLDALLFVFGVLLLMLAALRSYGLLMNWYTAPAGGAAPGDVAREFGPLLHKLGRTLIVLLATIFALEHLGVNVASLVVSLGVGSLALGLAAQDTLSNMFAGFTLMLDRPFRVGDRIVLATGEIGDVMAIGTRVTRIHTTDDALLVVPNSTLVRERLINQSQPTRHIVARIEVAVAQDTDLGTVKRLLLEAARAVPEVETEREPQALVTRLADQSAILLLVFWARDYLVLGRARSAVHEQISRRFRDAGVELAVPARRIIQGTASTEA